MLSQTPDRGWGHPVDARDFYISVSLLTFCVFIQAQVCNLKRREESTYLIIYIIAFYNLTYIPQVHFENKSFS
jgi:hypothetical protein